VVSIAREVLLHDKLRFVITVVSLGFAMVMIVYNTAMFFGVTEDSANLIDRAQAELWVFKEGDNHLNAPSLVPETMLGRARRLDGVIQACAVDILMGNLKISDNRQVTVVGIDPDCPLLLPWNVVEGDSAGLRRNDTVVVDDLALRSSPVRVGDVIKLNDKEMTVVAITRNNKSFSSPFVYTNLRTFTGIRGMPDYYSFVAVHLKPDADRAQIIQRLTSAHSDIAVAEAQEFRRATIAALIAQGVGMIFSVVFVGVLVGVLIITLTMYTATMERLRDFAILKALGATRWKIQTIVLEQAITETLASFGFGLAASWGVDYMVKTASGISVRFELAAVAGCLVAMLVLAILGSLISIRKAVSVDPGIVFRV